MNYEFEPGGLIIVRVRLSGPRTTREARLALDTGAEGTCIPPFLAADLGLSVRPGGVVLTASDIVPVLVARLPLLEAFGLPKRNVAVRVHPLPVGTRFAGLLGLDFFRDTRLSIDFRERTVDVS